MGYDDLITGPSMARGGTPTGVEIQGHIDSLAAFIKKLRDEVVKLQYTVAAGTPSEGAASGTGRLGTPSLDIAAGDKFWLHANYPKDDGNGGAVTPFVQIRVTLPAGIKLEDGAVTAVVGFWDTTKNAGFNASAPVLDENVGVGYVDLIAPTTLMGQGDSCSCILVALASSGDYAEQTYGAADRQFTAGTSLAPPENCTISTVHVAQTHTKFKLHIVRNWDDAEPYINCCNFYDRLEIWESATAADGDDPDNTAALDWEESDASKGLKALIQKMKMDATKKRDTLFSVKHQAGEVRKLAARIRQLDGQVSSQWFTFSTTGALSNLLPPVITGVTLASEVQSIQGSTGKVCDVTATVSYTGTCTDIKLRVVDQTSSKTHQATAEPDASPGVAYMEPTFKRGRNLHVFVRAYNGDAKTDWYDCGIIVAGSGVATLPTITVTRLEANDGAPDVYKVVTSSGGVETVFPDIIKFQVCKADVGSVTRNPQKMQPPIDAVNYDLDPPACDTSTFQFDVHHQANKHPHIFVRAITPDGKTPWTMDGSTSPTPLAASASASPLTGAPTLSVNFTGGASGGTSPYTYLWMFSDGTTSSLQNPSKSYTSNGTYTAQLKVTDSLGNTALSAILSILVTTTPTANPTAAISASPTSGAPPLSVTFGGSASGGTGSYVSWAWAFGDGATSSVQNPGVHSYAAAGTYNVTLTVTDTAGNKGVAYCTIVVSTTPTGGGSGSPSAYAGAQTGWGATGATGAPDGNLAGYNVTANGGVSAVLALSAYGFAIPAGATIQGIVVTVRAKAAVANLVNISSIRLTKVAGTGVGSDYTAQNDPLPATKQDLVYGAPSDKWGTTWTYSEINASGFGVIITCENNDTVNRYAYVDSVMVQVYYTT